MRKHFLILMLLTLLPLAGWAQTATIGEVALGKYTYGDASLPVPVIKDSEGAILTEKTHYTYENAKAYSDEACTSEVALKDMVANGTKYYMKITGAGAYVGQQKGVWFTVEKAPLVINYTASLDRTYGEDPVALVKAKFDLAGAKGYVWGQDEKVLKGDMPTGYTTADNNAGKDKKVTFVGGWTADNYEISYNEVLTIKPLDISGTAVITVEQGNVVYTGNDIIGVYTILDKAKGKTLTAGVKDKSGDYYVAAVKAAAKANKPTITFQGNYTGSIVPATGFDITPAPITISMKDISVEYDRIDHKDQSGAAEFEYSGIVGGDVANAGTIIGDFIAPTSVKAAVEAINPTDYTLEISGGKTNSANYEFKTYLPGKLTITRRTLEIAADGASKNLGEADPAYTVVIKNGSLIGSDVLAGVKFSRTAGEEIGKYDITPDFSSATVKSKDGKTNYTSYYNLVAFKTKGQLTINQGAIVVTIKNATKKYGQADPTFTYVATGLQGDELAAFTINRDKSAKDPEAVGSYALTATVVNPNPEKYKTLTVVPGILTIEKAELTFTIPAQNVKIGDDATALKKDGITVKGINNSDKAADLYDLAFDGGVSTASNNTYDAGIVATLTAAAAKCYTIKKGNTGKLIVGDGLAKKIEFKNDGKDYADFIKKQAGEKQDVTITIDNRTREVPAGTEHTWAAETWNTMVLPFEVTVEELSAQLGYAIVNRVDASKTTEGNVQFKLEMQKIPANEPFCVKTSKAIDDGKKINFSKKLIVDGGEYPSVDAGNGYKFVGAYKNLKINKDHSTYNFLRGDNVKWAHIGATSANEWTVVPFDAYVDLTAAAAPEMVTFTFQELDGSTTAIKNVEASVNEVNAVKTGWYTIDGKKLNAAPAQKGIYIYNGKKFVVK